MFGKLQVSLLLAVSLFVIAADAFGQKRKDVEPPPETASLAEAQAWLVGALGKYASYKTRVEAVTLSNVKFGGCEFGFTQSRKSESTRTATMGPTRTTYAAKDDISIPLAKIGADGISVSDHIYPELQTIKLSPSGSDLEEGAVNGRVFEIVVKREAADAIKTGLLQVQKLCTAKNTE